MEMGIKLKIATTTLQRWMERERYLSKQLRDTVKRIVAFAEVHPDKPVQLSTEDNIMVEEYITLRSMLLNSAPTNDQLMTMILEA